MPSLTRETYKTACRAFPGLSVQELGGAVTVHGVAAVAPSHRGSLRVISFDRDAAHWLAEKGIAPGFAASDVEQVRRAVLPTWSFSVIAL